jgi:nuclear pore complex protein Nup53
VGGVCQIFHIFHGVILTNSQDPAQADALLGKPLIRGMTSPTSLSDHNQVHHPNNVLAGEDVSSSQIHTSSTPTVGTPIKLASSASAFRKSRPTGKAPVFHAEAGLAQGTSSVVGEHSADKGMFGQVSDLIFGW